MYIYIPVCVGYFALVFAYYTTDCSQVESLLGDAPYTRVVLMYLTVYVILYICTPGGRRVCVCHSVFRTSVDVSYVDVAVLKRVLRQAQVLELCTYSTVV